MKVEKVIVGKGTTSSETKDGPWTRKYYEIQAVLEPTDDRQQVRSTLEKEIDAWLTQSNQPKRDVPRIPELDPAQINALPWKPYEKQPQGAWIFTDDRRPPGSERLIEAVKSAGGKFEIGEWTFSLSKDGTKPFLSRWPAKKK